MHETEQFSRLVGDIYDAALDPALWPTVLRAASEFIPGASGTLMSQDTLSGTAQFYFQWGNDPSFLKSYQDVYVKLNPVLVPALLRAKVGDVCSTVDFLPFDEFFATRFYKEWVAPQGLVDSVFCTLDASASSYAFVAFTRHERHGVVDARTRRRLKLLGPHFRRAVAIGKLIDLHKVEAAALTDALDSLAAAMFLVDSGGRIVHANAAGREMLLDASVVCLAGGKFAAADRHANRALKGIFTHAAGGDAALGSRGVAVQIATSDGTRYIADVLPLTSGRRRNAGDAYAAVAAVFVRKATFDLPHRPEAIANAFNLTPAETRVLMMIVEIGGVSKVAPVLGVSEATVRTHLQHIFEKTGVSRQADLVKLLASHTSLVRG